MFFFTFLMADICPAIMNVCRFEIDARWPYFLIHFLWLTFDQGETRRGGEEIHCGPRLQACGHFQTFKLEYLNVHFFKHMNVHSFKHSSLNILILTLKRGHFQTFELRYLNPNT